MPVKTFNVVRLEDGTWIVRNPQTGRLLAVNSVLQPGLTEQEARDAADLLKSVHFEPADEPKPAVTTH